MNLQDEQADMKIRMLGGIAGIRQRLMNRGHSAKEANALTLEMLRVKGDALEWTK